uniref:Uncharacterized protein n=1 Tax=Anguilla anguilla TaxID=7936 RepID=A0A0E9UF47_ANGAN
MEKGMTNSTCSSFFLHCCSRRSCLPLALSSLPLLTVHWLVMLFLPALRMLWSSHSLRKSGF